MKPGRYNIVWTADATGEATVNVRQCDLDSFDGLEGALLDALCDGSLPSEPSLENVQILQMIPRPGGGSSDGA